MLCRIVKCELTIVSYAICELLVGVLRVGVFYILQCHSCIAFAVYE